MAKKTYSIGWNNCSEVIIEIDHDVMTDEALHKINDLFLDSEDYLLYTKGKIVDAVLMRIASVCFYLLAEKSYTPQELMKEFERDPFNFMPKLDGSEGIKIIDCTQFEIDPSEFSILYVGDNHHE